MTEQIGSVGCSGLDRLQGSHSVLHHEGELPAAGPIRAHTSVCTEGHLYAGFHSFPKVLPLKLTQLRVMLQKVFGCGSLPTAFLDTLLIVDVHIEISSALDRHCDAFIVDDFRMLDRRCTGKDRVLDSLSGLSMDGHTQSKVPGFVNGRVELLGSEFYGVRIAAVGQHRTGGQHFDHIHAIVCKLPDALA